MINTKSKFSVNLSKSRIACWSLFSFLLRGSAPDNSISDSLADFIINCVKNIWIKNGVKRAVNWEKNNCRNNIGGVHQLDPTEIDESHDRNRNPATKITHQQSANLALNFCKGITLSNCNWSVVDNPELALVTAPQLEKLLGRQANIFFKDGVIKYLRIFLSLGKHRESIRKR